jgi:hypothetical protein
MLGRFPIKWNPVDRRKRPKYQVLSKLRAPAREVCSVRFAGDCMFFPLNDRKLAGISG